MQILWLDCRSEFTGEALVGALADLGVSPSTFEWELSGIDLGDHHLHFDREEIQGIRAVHFGVHGGALHVDDGHSSEHHHNHTQADLIPYTKLRTQIEGARVSDFVKSHSLGIFSKTSINEQIEASPLGAAILAEFGATLARPPELKSVKTGHGLSQGSESGESVPLQAKLGEVEITG